MCWMGANPSAGRTRRRSFAPWSRGRWRGQAGVFDTRWRLSGSGRLRTSATDSGVVRFRAVLEWAGAKQKEDVSAEAEVGRSLAVFPSLPLISHATEDMSDFHPTAHRSEEHTSELQS